VATLATDNANFREEITSVKNQHSSVKSDTTACGFFDNVLVLQNASDVTKLKMLPIISQFGNPRGHCMKLFNHVPRG
jgi:hypothetical protein